MSGSKNKIRFLQGVAVSSCRWRQTCEHKSTMTGHGRYVGRECGMRCGLRSPPGLGWSPALLLTTHVKVDKLVSPLVLCFLVSRTINGMKHAKCLTSATTHSVLSGDTWGGGGRWGGRSLFLKMAALDGGCLRSLLFTLIPSSFSAIICSVSAPLFLFSFVSFLFPSLEGLTQQRFPLNLALFYVFHLSRSF